MCSYSLIVGVKTCKFDIEVDGDRAEESDEDSDEEDQQQQREREKGSPGGGSDAGKPRRRTSVTSTMMQPVTQVAESASPKHGM